jgi:enoyl-CoA hydratase/carnithine racemase
MDSVAWILPKLVGLDHALELIYTAKVLDAKEAKEIGLVTSVAQPGGLRAEVDRVLADLAACAPLSIAKAKEAIDAGIDLPIDDALALERRCYDVTLFSEDRDEGLRAFAERRPPTFQGR